MSKPRLFIDGEAGTTGLQIASRLAGRDDLTVLAIDPEQRKDDEERRRLLNGVDLAVLCLPDEAARAAVAVVDNPAVRILDASTAHRILPDWTYGFAELEYGQAARIAAASRVANPGCYATAAIALLRPLIDAGLLPADTPLTVTGVSGYSGGGRAMIAAFEGPLRDPYQAYGLGLDHKHTPEIAHHAGLARKPLFTPAVGRFRQGMLVTVPLHLWAMPGAPTGQQVHAALTAHYAGGAVTVRPYADRPATLAPDALNDTDQLELFVFDNPTEGTALLVARLDNLGKGAAGAAVQNINLMLGLVGHG